MVLEWIRCLVTREPKAKARPGRRPVVRPSLETLEGRWVPAAIRTIPGFTSHALERVNDANSVLANVGFTLNFFGANTDRVFVNENGNLSFNEAIPEFTTPRSLTQPNGSNPIIAPFFADVDTSNPASGIITYGTGTLAGFKVFGVTYHNVGYYTTNPELQLFNSFQVILIDRSDTGEGNFDIEFNYDKIQWETGDKNNPFPIPGTVGQSDDGTGQPVPWGTGTGGQSVRVGYSAGTGLPGQSFELGGSGTFGSLVDTGLLALINRSRLASTPGRYHFLVRNGRVVGGMNFEVTSGTRVHSPLRTFVNNRLRIRRFNLVLRNIKTPANPANLALDLTPTSSVAANGSFPGPITVVFTRLPRNAKVLRPTGYTATGDPYITIPRARLPLISKVLRVQVTLKYTTIRPLGTFFAGFPVRVFAGRFDRSEL